MNIALQQKMIEVGRNYYRPIEMALSEDVLYCGNNGTNGRTTRWW